MRKVTEESVRAFKNNRNIKSGNTQVVVEDGVVSMYLHGNKIARKNISTNVIEINNCGYESNVTKDRINSIIDSIGGDRIYQSQFVWYWKDAQPFLSNRWNTL